MSLEYKVSKELINGKRCLEHLLNSEDLQIHGKNGFIVQAGPKSFKAAITNYKIYNGLAFRLGHEFRVQKGDEAWLEFSESQFDDVYAALKVPAYLKGQITYSKRFNTPF